eukprot:scaffold59240_cov66-Phaeocystis_antarctica.AAC.5
MPSSVRRPSPGSETHSSSWMRAASSRRAASAGVRFSKAMNASDRWLRLAEMWAFTDASAGSRVTTKRRTKRGENRR